MALSGSAKEAASRELARPGKTPAGGVLPLALEGWEGWQAGDGQGRSSRGVVRVS